MANDRDARTADEIVRVVVELLETEGYDGVPLRLVAKRARVSLATIYRFFPTRDDLMVTAVGRWMEENCYSNLVDPPSDASLYDGLMWFFRKIFEAWERSPRMLGAYCRAVSSPGGERLALHGVARVEPPSQAFFEGLDPDYVKDLRIILANLMRGLIQRFAAGELAIAEILPLVERTLYRLTSNNEAAAVASQAPRRRRQAARRARRPRGRSTR